MNVWCPSNSRCIEDCNFRPTFDSVMFVRGSEAVGQVRRYNTYLQNVSSLHISQNTHFIHDDK